jgi:hypothetical protein
MSQSLKRHSGPPPGLVSEVGAAANVIVFIVQASGRALAFFPQNQLERDAY